VVYAEETTMGIARGGGKGGDCSRQLVREEEEGVQRREPKRQSQSGG